MKKTLVTIISALMLTTSAYAGGFAIGVAGSLYNVEADVTETTTKGTVTGGAANTNKAGVDNNNVLVPNLYAEYAFENFYNIALGYEYYPGTADVSDTVKTRLETPASGDNVGVSKTYKGQAEISNLRTAYIEIPIYQSFYVKAGMSQVDIETQEAIVKAYGNVTSLDGQTFGVGYKNQVDSGIMYKVAYEETNFDTISLTSTSGNKISGDLDTSGIKVSVGYVF
jgi:hypothetical protein